MTEYIDGKQRGVAESNTGIVKDDMPPSGGSAWGRVLLIGQGEGELQLWRGPGADGGFAEGDGVTGAVPAGEDGRHRAHLLARTTVKQTLGHQIRVTVGGPIEELVKVQLVPAQQLVARWAACGFPLLYGRAGLCHVQDSVLPEPLRGANGDGW